MTATTPLARAAGKSGNRSVAAWAVRQTLLGLLILVVVIGGSAWLLHASIEPTADLPAATAPQNQG